MPLCRFYLLDPSNLRGLETSISHFDTDLILFWGIHARELEYLEYVSLLGQVPDCHNVRDSSLLTEKNKYIIWPHPQYHRTVEGSSALHVSEPARIMRTNSFNEAITASTGTVWVEKLGGAVLVQFSRWTLVISAVLSCFCPIEWPISICSRYAHFQHLAPS
jgi:hypothetical protein